MVLNPGPSAFLNLFFHFIEAFFVGIWFADVAVARVKFNIVPSAFSTCLRAFSLARIFSERFPSTLIHIAFHSEIESMEYSWVSKFLCGVDSASMEGLR